MDMPAQAREEEAATIIGFEEKKRRHNKKVGLKGQRQEKEEHSENARDFQYFY